MAGKLAVLALYLSAFAVALPAPASHVVHEERDEIPSRWIKRDRVPAHAKLPVRIGLTQSNLDNAHEHLFDVANPDSPNYGNHWTSEQVIDMFKPADETIDSVREWLVRSGIDKDSITLSGNKAWLAFTATAERMEALLHTEYFEFEDAATGGIMPACDRYHVPKHIQEHLDYITPGIRLLAPFEKPKEREKRSLSKRQWPQHRSSLHHGPWPHRPYPHHNPGDLSTCDIAITPACIAALYNIPPGHLADPTNSLGIFEAELQYWDQLDLDSFFTNFASWIPNGTHPINVQIDGGVAQTTNISAAGDESMLDLEIAYPIGKSAESSIKSMAVMT
jgi:tripeptidyl-peptidase-1